MTKVSPIGRVSYPSVYEPNEYKGKESYQLTLLFDKDTDLSEMKAEAARVVKEKWGDKKPKDFDNPFRDGNEKDDAGAEYENVTYVRFKRSTKKGPPQVVDSKKQAISEGSGEFYAGCYARVSYSCFAWEEGKKGGVSFGLANVQKMRDGESFDGRSTAEQDFDAVESADDEVLF
jgi:hypothetical protein